MSLLSRLAVQAARAYGILSSRNTNVPASYLAVAGGAGGGGALGGLYAAGGGGGAGGYQTSTFILSTLNTYSITVGAGGTSGTQTADGGNGGNSVISGTGLTTVTSVGGGGGAFNGSGGSPRNGQNGGSGGGSSGAGGTGGTATSGQGNNGGSVTTNTGGGPGGGGAGAVGTSLGSTTSGGAGGNGLASSISGSSVTYAGGGGGGGYSPGSAASGGSGGGGAGGASASNGTAGTANTGGGGGSGGGTPTGGSTAGGAGGSGIVIISYTSATPRFVGGTLTTSGGNQIHTFTSSGTLSPLTPITASYLVVAGGGGAVGNRSGGGGAGGLLTSSTTLYSGATYVVTVGAGGAGGAGNAAVTSTQDGSNSVLSGTGLTTLTATGGGGGGGTNNPSSGRAGGSGGGAGGDNATGATGGTGISGQGFAGGTTAAGGGAGGGGASAVGSNGASNTGGNGGAGTASSITGTSVTYAGGGGGGATTTAGTGGAGGGGNGAQGSPTTQLAGVSGTQNLGGGAGGGSNYSSTPVTQASGGSGIVIISYAGSQAFNGGLVTSSGGNTIHTFNATGALTPLTNNLTNSLRFRNSASAYLNRTPTVSGNRQTWTWSGWVKRGTLGARQHIFVSANPVVNTLGQQEFQICFDSSDKIEIAGGVSGVGNDINIITTQVFRDPSAWYHMVVAVDTTQATSANRVKFYVNGNQVTAFGTATYPAQNYNTSVNLTGFSHRIGGSGGSYFDGYQEDINLIDGQALEPYYFGNNDANGVWKPILYKGTYGTNGFYLNFSDTSAATAAAIGKDSSPNGNNWTPNNINLNTPINTNTSYDAMTDVPTNTSATVANFPVMTPAYLPRGSYTLSEANLRCSGAYASSNYPRIMSSMGMTSGKYYWEYVGVTFPATESCSIGIKEVSSAYPSATGGLGAVSGEIGLFNTGRLDNNGSTTVGFSTTFTTGDVIGMAFDATNGTLNYYKNGSAIGSQITGIAAGTYAPAFDCLSTSQTVWCVNYGQRPFAQTPPTGFVALNTFNLPTPTILQGNKYMDATLYTGQGVVQTVVNAGQFKPDLVWQKPRNEVASHRLVDSVRGVNNVLYSNQTAVAATETTTLTAFNSNGFTGGGSNAVSSGNTAVAWQWQAGQGSTTTGTGTGGITSVTQSVNTTSGFSIVTYTGSGSNGTVTHGLGVAPSMVIVKSRTTAENWMVYHISTGATKYIYLDSNGAAVTLSTIWNNTAPTSSVFSIGTNVTVNQSSISYVAYCFAEIAGFSKFGSYVGNSNVNGPFIYLGFRPKYVLIKNITSYDWHVFDAARNAYNLTNSSLKPDTTGAEYTNDDVSVDFLSNGFKLRGTDNAINYNGDTHIYMAFAENPFKNANAR